MNSVGAYDLGVKWKTTRLTGSLGAEVAGVDINAFGKDDAGHLAELIARRHVLLFRGQWVDNEQLKRFGALFGELNKFAFKGYVADEEGAVLIMRNDPIHAVTALWHTDAPIYERPPAYSILAERKIPEAGGDTLFANQHAAFDSLSEGFKTLLRGLKAVHSYEYGGQLGAKTQIHPVVRVHPISKREALYISRSTVKRFDGITEEESRPLLELIFDRATDHDFRYRHVWAKGDVIMWDNRSVMHRSTHDYGSDPDARLMHTIQCRPEPVYGPNSLEARAGV